MRIILAVIVALIALAPVANASPTCRTKHYSNAHWTYCDDGTSWHCTDDGRCYY